MFIYYNIKFVSVSDDEIYQYECPELHYNNIKDDDFNAETLLHDLNWYIITGNIFYRCTIFRYIWGVSVLFVFP